MALKQFSFDKFRSLYESSSAAQQKFILNSGFISSGASGLQPFKGTGFDRTDFRDAGADIFGRSTFALDMAAFNSAGVKQKAKATAAPVKPNTPFTPQVKKADTKTTVGPKGIFTNPKNPADPKQVAAEKIAFQSTNKTGPAGITTDPLTKRSRLMPFMGGDNILGMSRSLM